MPTRSIFFHIVTVSICDTSKSTLKIMWSFNPDAYGKPVSRSRRVTPPALEKAQEPPVKSEEGLVKRRFVRRLFNFS